jgi:uncharacterized membrane protein YeaQ/YmgE (transglycosylase-associated protein family)
MDMSHLLVWVILGLVAGVVAKMIMPGKDKGGVITTILVGVGGALLGGWLGSRLGVSTDASGNLSVLSFATAIGGALVLLLVMRLIRAAV